MGSAIGSSARRAAVCSSCATTSRRCAGAGRGFSVLELIAAASKAAGRDIPYELAPRRPGDSAAIWADPSLARKKLRWSTTRDLDRMCADHWRWQKNNPNGYRSA